MIDLRSPSEYAQGHIPTAINVPIFTDEERAIVGTAYKKQGQEVAIQLGHQFFDPKVKNLIKILPNPCVCYCWRGGLRSQKFAEAIRKENFEVHTLKGGYKSFRRGALDFLEKHPFQFRVIGGMTGAGKTEKLHELQSQGEQILDLEGLANHRGSSFGSLGQPPQPTQEQFENEIAWLLQKFDPTRPIFVEDESRQIGHRNVPKKIYQAIRTSPMQIVESTLHERLERLVKTYGNFPKKELIEATLRIQKKLGGLRTQQAIALLEQNDPKAAFAIIIDYYDRSYEHTMLKRNSH